MSIILSGRDGAEAARAEASRRCEKGEKTSSPLLEGCIADAEAALARAGAQSGASRPVTDNFKRMKNVGDGINRRRRLRTQEI